MRFTHLLAPLLAALILACLSSHAYASDLSPGNRALASLHQSASKRSILASGNEHETKLPTLSTSAVILPRNATPASKSLPVFPDISLIPTATALPEEVSLNISERWYGKQLNFPANLGFDPSKLVSIQCNDCSITGQLVVKQGNWSLTELGFLEVNLDHLVTKFDMLVQGEQSGYVAFPFVPDTDGDIPIPDAGFKIPGFGKAGLMVHPEFVFSWNFTKPLAIGYATTWEMTGNPIIHVDFSNLTSDPFSRVGIGMYGAGTLTSRSIEIENGDASISVLDSVVAGVTAEAEINMNLPSLNISSTVLPSSDINDVCMGDKDYEMPEDPVMRNFTATYPKFVRGIDTGGMAVGSQFNVSFPWMTDDSVLSAIHSQNFINKAAKRCYAMNTKNNTFSSVYGVFADIRNALRNENADHNNTDNSGNITSVWSRPNQGAAATTLPNASLSLLMGGLMFAGVAFLVCF
ncbi:hypothetical protein SLS55_005959 [Diplodia seriata]|uniref:Peptidase A1 domain-containing protein n=1 Tax=Diplodia seriata TaxID=420778 RepID=A0ABR3CDX7_9PEZI